jgi:hypothetical protein
MTRKPIYPQYGHRRVGAITLQAQLHAWRMWHWRQARRARLRHLLRYTPRLVLLVLFTAWLMSLG